ncbi:MAG: S66 peptidase family protein [Elainellaceae cyanobacterium]
MPTRRQINHALLTGAITSLLASLTKPGQAVESSVIKPDRLQSGDRIGIVSPASATFLREDFDIVADAVRGLGLVPHAAPHIFARRGYLGGTDDMRASDINQMFADPNIAAILPVRGGWGCSRILPYLDYDSIQQNPKILVGFSDLTALILGIYAKTGLVTFHGPNGLTGWRTYQTEWFRRILFEGESPTFVNVRDAADGDRLMQVNYRIQTITPGNVQGRLVGGNLSVLSALVGSPYLPDFQGSILFLEDIGETIYRIDRMMTQLKLAGILDQIAGFVFGQCRNCRPDESYGSLTLEDVIWDHIQPLGIPAWYGAMIGHIEPIATLPIGLPVEIDATAGTIAMLESAVI